jgi:hypothetical protein
MIAGFSCEHPVQRGRMGLTWPALAAPEWERVRAVLQCLDLNLDKKGPDND